MIKNKSSNQKISYAFIFSICMHLAFIYIGANAINEKKISITQIDKKKALNILAKLKIDIVTENYRLLQEKLK